MNSSTKARLAALDAFLKSRQGKTTLFILEGGAAFRTKQDPFGYLLEHGAFTPDGRRIVKYPHPVEGVDPLSLALYEMLDEAVERGKLELPDVEGDAP